MTQKVPSQTSDADKSAVELHSKSAGQSSETATNTPTKKGPIIITISQADADKSTA
jgi:hypothetical protein